MIRQVYRIVYTMEEDIYGEKEKGNRKKLIVSARRSRSAKPQGRSPQRKTKWHEDSLWLASLTTRAPSGADFKAYTKWAHMRLQNSKDD